jgi:three-Cys-motif partner protein
MAAELVYLFIEADKKRCESLDAVLGKLEIPKSVSISIYNQKCEEALNSVLGYLDEKKSKLAPTFAFIDPFGVQVPLDMVARLMAHPKCEVLITFMLSALHRWISTPEFQEPTDRLYGCTDWRKALDMVGKEREKFLRTLYQNQLETAVGAKYVRFFTMKDGKNKTIYDLFFATNHRSGIDAMKDAMWKVDQTGGGYTFSDATDPDQETLFEAKPNWDQLFDLLLLFYGGSEQPWEEVEETIRRTPFRIMRNDLKAESRRENSRFTIVPPAGAKKGTLGPGTVIRFPASH